ncbi:MAG: hypothetical protein PHW62_05330 [Candidatus Ratteibacteria bacterium]|nr:hypothetical protein [Candidatus Ratteibacteria bacterium]
MKRILFIALLFIILCGCSEKPVEDTSNSIFIIAPYNYEGAWVFDDASRGLKQEPFVAGIPGIIEKLVEDIPDAEKGFRLYFSAQPFPGYTHTLVWIRGDSSGNWYECPQYKMEGWLCPAMFKYFNKAPKVIYFKAEKK